MHRKILFKKDSKGNVRQWNMEIVDNKYRTISGLVGGQLVTSTWKEAFGKNEGKSNATTDETQAIAEVDSIYVNKRHSGYSEEVTDLGWFKPMLADKYKKFPGGLVYIQPKLDGIRCLITPNGIHSRTGKPLMSAEYKFFGLIEIAKELNMIFDGELYNHQFYDDFNRISSLVRKQRLDPEDFEDLDNYLQYHVYDQFYLDKPNMSFTDRNQTFYGYPHVIRVPTYRVESETEVDKHLIDFITAGYEGAIIRLGDSAYEQKRSKNLLKYKMFDDDEFEILDVVEGKGNWSKMAKSLLVRLSDGQECASNMRGSQAYMAQVLEQRNEYIGGIATVRYLGYTPDRMLRCPVATSLCKAGETRL